MREPKYDLRTDNPAAGAVPRFNPSASLGTQPPVAAPFVHPFQLRPDPDNAGQVLFAEFSLLFGELPIDASSTYTISGITSSFSVSPGDFIYLHGVITTGSIFSLEILVDSTAFDAVVFDGGGDQSDFYLALAFVDSPPDPTIGNPGFRLDSNTWVFQYAFTNFRMTSFCVDGAPALFPVAT